MVDRQVLHGIIHTFPALSCSVLEMTDARHHDFARVNVVCWGDHGKLAQRRSARRCADVQAVSAGPLVRHSATARPHWPNLHDAWQDNHQEDRKSTRLNSSTYSATRMPSSL